MRLGLTAVCGEPCSIQVCGPCATHSQKEQIVDVLLQATLASTLQQDPTCRLVTLGCGHIFTVGTLDGAMGLEDVYKKDQAQAWTCLRQAVGFQTPKTCPACCGPVISPRYGRVTKRAILDIQEQSAVRRYLTELKSIQDQLLALCVESIKSNIAPTFSKIVPPAPGKGSPLKLAALSSLPEGNLKCIHPGLFENRTRSNIFGIVGSIADAWNKLVQPYMDIYQPLAVMINSEAMPHTMADEAVVATTYGHEMELLLLTAVQQGYSNTVTKELWAAQHRVGTAPLVSHAWFKIEALHQTVRIRLKMAEIAGAISDHLWNATAPESMGSGGQIASKVKELNRLTAAAFVRLGYGLLLSCQRDARLAIRLAIANMLPRQVLLGHLLNFEVAFETMQRTSAWELRHKTNDGEHSDLARGLRARHESELRILENDFAQAVANLVLDSPQVHEFATSVIVPAVDGIITEWVKVTSKFLNRLCASVSLVKNAVSIRAALGIEWGGKHTEHLR